MYLISAVAPFQVAAFTKILTLNVQRVFTLTQLCCFFASGSPEGRSGWHELRGFSSNHKRVASFDEFIKATNGFNVDWAC